ncbi:AAA family ATPase [Nostoc parmelioides FACHB-3921]|uniref:AAA family ATPase n=2 Tax=Nostoc TaxID=1177 RepID=A0ABR8BMY6_9NOSO|nr:AAA family ATPase [Nostoc parmelioides FACHB-3921]
MKQDIILIGPIGTGKSTLGTLLAEKLNLPQISMDELRYGYYKRIGYDEAFAKKLRAEKGFLAIYQYWKPFEAYAVEMLLAEHSNCVIDFGAGHSVYDDAALFYRVQKVLETYPNVVLVLPSPDLDESVQIIKERMGEFQENGVDVHEYFVKHSSNLNLAKIVVYTKGKTPEQTGDEILSLIKTSSY